MPRSTKKKTSKKTGDHMGLAKRLADARETAGYSVAQAARRLGVKSRTFQGWESGDTEPRANQIMTVAGLLGVSAGWLLTGDSDLAPSDTMDDEVDFATDLNRLKQLYAEMGEILARIT